MGATSLSLIERGELSDSARQSGRSDALSMVCALFGREFRAALINRYFQVFCALGLMGGIAAAIFGEDANATAVFYVQIAIYFVSLFALLAGVGSAQAEREEWQLLFSQPLPRAACVVGKFCALLSMFGGVLLLMFVPGLFAGSSIRAVTPLYFETFLLAAAFAFGAARFDFAPAATRLRFLLGTAAVTPPRLRATKYSFIGSK